MFLCLYRNRAARKKKADTLAEEGAAVGAAVVAESSNTTTALASKEATDPLLLVDGVQWMVPPIIPDDPTAINSYPTPHIRWDAAFVPFQLKPLESYFLKFLPMAALRRAVELTSSKLEGKG